MQIRILIIGIAVALTGFSSCNQGSSNAELLTESDSVSYWMGVVLGNNLKQDGFDTVNPQVLARAFGEVFNDEDLLFETEEAQALLYEYYQKQQEKNLSEEYNENKLAGERFLDENKNKEGVVTLASGLQYKILKEGEGPKPALTDVVTVHYKGSLIDGTVFESSFEGDPVSFGVNGVIQGWTEALQLMNAGSRWEVYIPQELAYGAQYRQNSPIEPYSTLVFEVELISFETSN